MTSIYNNSVSNYWHFLFEELADPRTNDWFLIKSPLPGLTIIGLYLYFVTSWGPRWMKDRKPFELTNTLIVYNFFQICVSTFITLEALQLWLQPNFSFVCYPVDFSVNDDSMREARDVYIYFLAKITELLDTIFFVLRKKDRQITFLHLYHHTVMPMISWGTTKYYPGGHGTFVGAINSFIHIIMYTYYMLAAFGPKIQPYLWWKKYITVLQMLQFLLVFLHNAQLLWVPCDYPLFSLYFTLPNAILFIYLFNDFYTSSYKKRKIEEMKKEKNNYGKVNEIDHEEVRKGTELRQRLRNGENGIIEVKALANNKSLTEIEVKENAKESKELIFISSLTQAEIKDLNEEVAAMMEEVNNVHKVDPIDISHEETMTSFSKGNLNEFGASLDKTDDRKP